MQRCGWRGPFRSRPSGVSVPRLPPTEEGERTDAGDAPTREESSHRTPDQSTLGLASSSQPTGAPARGEGDVAALDVGETLAGRFTVLRFIARGGMGAVYEATDVLLRTRVAIKLIGGRLAGDATALERFRREVLLARRVSHPNVCRVYELYEARTARGIAIHFLTMELLEGESLARRLARNGRMKTDEALPLVKQMCEGLAAAHAEGVIHRDFKSSNVLLVPRSGTEGERTTESTRVVITDFGVARALTLASGEDAGEGPLTGQGILGTPEYMAPEQVTGSEVTAASDIYALGVVLYEMVTGKLPFAADTPLAAAARRLNEAPPRPETTVPGLDKRWAATIVRCLARQPERRFRSAQDIIPALDRPARSRRVTVSAALAAAVLLLVGTYGVVKYRPSLRLGGPDRSTAFVAPRTKVAVLGIRDELKTAKLKWLPTAATELLAYELAAAESSLRIVGTDMVDLERRSLGISGDEVGEPKSQERLQALADADVLVHGSISPAGTGSDGVRLRLQALDAHSRRDLGAVEEDLGPGGARLVEALSSLGTSLRSLLRVSMTSEEESALAASRAHTLDAAKLHAEGVMRRRLWDIDEARSHFEAAVAADPSFFLPHKAIINAWGIQSNRKKYLESLKRIQALGGGLTRRQAAMVGAELVQEQDEGKATETWKALFEASPDDFEVGSHVIGRSPPRAKLAVIKRMQQLRAGPPLVLELREATAAGLGIDDQRSEVGLNHVAARATELGARWELGRARMFLAQRVPIVDPKRWKDALAGFAEAERLFTEVGEVDNIAEVKRQKALWLAGTGSRREAFASMDDAAGAFRRLGDREQVAHLLLVTADYLRDFGELSMARKKLEEARLELETIDSRPDGLMFGYYFRVRAFQLFDEGDFQGARDALRRARRSATMPSWPEYVELLEASLLNEEDHREEARAAYSKASTDPAIRVAGVCGVDCDGDRPAAGLECLAKACRTDQPEFGGVRKASCQVEEAYCRFRASDLAGAEQAAHEAASFLDSKDYYELALRNRGILMRAAAARGESVKALRVLRADLAKVESEKNTRLAFETALALGDVEIKAGRREGRVRLAKLEQEARAREFFRIARLAREVLDQKAVASAAPQR